MIEKFPETLVHLEARSLAPPLTSELLQYHQSSLAAVAPNEELTTACREGQGTSSVKISPPSISQNAEAATDDLNQELLEWKNMNTYFRPEWISDSLPCDYSVKPRHSGQESLAAVDHSLLTGKLLSRLKKSPAELPHVSASCNMATSNRKQAECGPLGQAVGQRPNNSNIDNVYLVQSVHNPERVLPTSLVDSDKERSMALRSLLRLEWIAKRRRENDDITLLAARRIFGALDVDNDGCLSGDELEHLAAWMWSTFNESDGQPTKAELDEAMDYSLCLMDVNNTGVIDFQSFCKWYLTSTAMEQPQV